VKTTIKTSQGKAVVTPYTSCICLEIDNKETFESAGMVLTPDEAGVLIFSLEQELAAMQQSKARAMAA